MELHELLEDDEVTTKVATLRQIDQRECTQRSQYSRVSGKGDTKTTIIMDIMNMCRLAKRLKALQCSSSTRDSCQFHLELMHD